MHEAKLAKMEAEMKAVFQQKVMEKESRLKQSEEELYARHRDMKESLEKQRADLEEKKRRVESGRPLTPERSAGVRPPVCCALGVADPRSPADADQKADAVQPPVRRVSGDRVLLIVSLEPSMVSYIPIPSFCLCHMSVRYPGKIVVGTE
jgi:hypothetical protein